MNAIDEPAAPPPSPPPPHEPVRRLTRSTDDKVLTGLCGGLGRYFGVDPVIFRIGFVVLSLAGGTGLLLYLAGWLLVPDDRGVTEADKWFPQRTRKLTLVVLAVIGIALLSNGLNDARGDVPIGLVLVGIGAAVLWSRRNRSTDPGHPGGPVGPVGVPASRPGGASPAATATATTTTTTATAPEPIGDPTSAAPTVDRTAQFPPYPPAPPPSPRERSVLVPVTLSLLLVLGGALALLGVTLATGLAILLLATGVALVVGAWRGRARLLIPVAVLLGLALATASLVDVPVSGGIGERVYRPLTVSELRSPYRLAVGQLTLDLSAVDLSGRTATVLVTTGIGETDVIVPDSVQVVVTGHAGAGAVELFGESREGTRVDRRVVSPGREGGGRLVIGARVGLGQVEVRRAAA